MALSDAGRPLVVDRRPFVFETETRDGTRVLLSPSSWPSALWVVLSDTVPFFALFLSQIFTLSVSFVVVVRVVNIQYPFF